MKIVLDRRAPQLRPLHSSAQHVEDVDVGPAPAERDADRVGVLCPLLGCRVPDLDDVLEGVRPFAFGFVYPPVTLEDPTFGGLRLS